MRPKFVTAIYTDLEGTRFNGNPAAIYERYKLSLLSLAKGGYEIVCYTSDAHFEELSGIYAAYPNVRLIVQELSSNPFHADIEKIKDREEKYTTERSWSSRCVEIMWGKFFWLKENLTQLSDEDSLFWIDAGLFHGGLIPAKYKSKDSSHDFDFDVITQNRNLFSELENFSRGKIFNITSIWVNHGMDDYVQVFKERPEYGVIGGIFGGQKKLLIDYINEIIRYMNVVIESGMLLKEEELMYLANKKNPENYTKFLFDSWYHEDWEIYNKDSEISFSDIFEVIHVT